MDNIKPTTIAGFVLALVSLMLITVDWRASAIVAVLAAVVAIRNLREAE